MILASLIRSIFGDAVKWNLAPGLAALVFSVSVSAASARSDEKPRTAETTKNSLCDGIVDIVREQRLARQMKELEVLQQSIDAKILLLNKRRNDLQDTKKTYDEFVDRAQDIVVDMYAKMRPDAAAGRLAVVENGLAAAILLKLSARQSSVILNEMKTETAAVLTTLMAASTSSLSQK